MNHGSRGYGTRIPRAVCSACPGRYDDAVAAFEALVRAGHNPLEAVCELAGVDPVEVLGGAGPEGWRVA